MATTSCQSITSGRARGCRDSVGGVIDFYIGTKPTSSVWATDDEAGTITGITGFSAYTFSPNKNSGEWSETIESNLENGTVGYNQTCTMSFNKNEAALRTKVQILAQDNVCIIVRERSGKYFLLGKSEGMELSAGNGGSGRALTDLQGYTLTFSAMEKEPAFEVSATLITNSVVMDI